MKYNALSLGMNVSVLCVFAFIASRVNECKVASLEAVLEGVHTFWKKIHSICVRVRACVRACVRVCVCGYSYLDRRCHPQMTLHACCVGGSAHLSRNDFMRVCACVHTYICVCVCVCVCVCRYIQWWQAINSMDKAIDVKELSDRQMSAMCYLSIVNAANIGAFLSKFLTHSSQKTLP